MKPDPLDQLSARLFDAARQELPPEGAEQRLLTTVLGAARQVEQRTPFVLQRRLMAGVALGVVSLAAALLFQLTRRTPPESISAEPAPTHSAARKTPLSAESPPSASASVSAEPAPPTAPSIVKPQLTPQPSASAAVSLSDELDALKVASNALAAGDARAALGALDRYDHVLKGSKLRAEATLLRIQALARSGDARAASALAQRFVDQNPDSPLVDRARSFIQTAGLGGN